MDKIKKFFDGFALIFVPVLFICFFLFFPILTLVKVAFSTGGRFNFSSFLSIVTDSYTLRVLYFTFKEAFVSAFVTVLIGLPGAYIVSHYNFRFKSFLMSLSTVPFVLPSVLVGLGFIVLFGRNGILNNALSYIFGRNVDIHLLYSFTGIILVHSFYNFPIALRIVGSSWDGISEEYSYVAKSLGASKVRTFFAVTLPLLLPSVLSSFSLVFIFCFLSFVIIMTIGGAGFATTEVAIYMYYNTFSDFRTGSVLAIIQALILVIFVLIYLRAEGLSGVGIVKRTFSYTKQKWSRLSFSLSFSYLIFVFLLIVAPMIVIVLSSFVASGSPGLSLSNFKQIFEGTYNYITGVSSGRVILNSVYFGLITVCLSIGLAIPSAYYLKLHTNLKKYVLPFLMFSIVLSPLTIALSYIVTFQPFINSSPFNWIFIAISHTLIAFPFVLRSIMPVVESTSTDFALAARSLGLSKFKTFFTVDIDLIKKPLVSAATFAFAISMGEFGATLMLFRSENTTIPIALYRLMSGRHFGAAQAFGTILLIMSLLAFLLIDSLNS
ncbi:MAG: ABC transporter permease, partial [Caldisericaceae bacterium]